MILVGFGARWLDDVEVGDGGLGHACVVVHDEGTELIDVVIIVDFVHDCVVSRSAVPLVEEHLKEDSRVFVAS